MLVWGSVGNFGGILLGNLELVQLSSGQRCRCCTGGGRSQPLAVKQLQDSHLLQVRSKYRQDCFSQSFGVMAVRNALCLLVCGVFFSFYLVVNSIKPAGNCCPSSAWKGLLARAVTWVGFSHLEVWCGSASSRRS